MFHENLSFKPEIISMLLLLFMYRMGVNILLYKEKKKEKVGFIGLYNIYLHPHLDQCLILTAGVEKKCDI